MKRNSFWMMLSTILIAGLLLSACAPAPTAAPAAPAAPAAEAK